MTEELYEKLVDIRNNCYRKRRDENKEINYFTGFNDGYEIATKELQEENAELKKKYVKNITDCDICDTYCNSLLIKAKEIIKELYEGLDKLYLSGLSNKQIAFIEQLQDKTEQFLKEVEK